jgi:hypothetical protein
MKNYQNLIYLIIFIFLQIKCLDVLVEDPYYKNIQLLYEGRLLLFIYGNEQFGDYCIVDDYNYNEHSEIINDKISLSYTSKNYQYVEIEEIFNHFLYTSYLNNTNYSLKLIIFDTEMENDFNIPSNSIVPNVEVIYASEKNQFVFFGNKLYKYNVNITINDNVIFPEKQIIFNSVSEEKTINFNDINLKINSQSMISIDNSILLITYIYQNSSKNFIVSEIYDYSLQNLVDGEVLSDTQSIIKINEVQNFNFLKTLNFNNNILYVYVDDSKFYYSVKKLLNSNNKYSLKDIANCDGSSGYCYSSLSNDCDVSNVENFNVAILSDNLFVVGCNTINTEIRIEIMKYNNDETKDAKLNMKTHYIISYDDEQKYNKINLGVITNSILLLTIDNTNTYYGFVCPTFNFNFVTTTTNSDDDDTGSMFSSSTQYIDTKLNEYVEFNFDLININSEFNMNSNVLNNICFSHEYEYLVYFEKIIFRENDVIEKTLNENNVLYYSSQTDTNNKILVEIGKNYDVNNKYYIKSTAPGAIVIYYSINYKFKCTPNYQTFEDNDNDSDKIFSYNKMITVYVNGCNDNCENCVEDNGMFECQKCKDGYYPKLNDENFCYDKLEGYILKDDKLVECFTSCATCSIANQDIPFAENIEDIQMFCT